MTVSEFQFSVTIRTLQLTRMLYRRGSAGMKVGIPKAPPVFPVRKQIVSCSTGVPGRRSTLRTGRRQSGNSQDDQSHGFLADQITVRNFEENLAAVEVTEGVAKKVMPPIGASMVKSAAAWTSGGNRTSRYEVGRNRWFVVDNDQYSRYSRTRSAS